MNKAKFLPVALLFYSLAPNAGEWDKIDYTLGAISTTTLILDWRQATYGLHHPQRVERDGSITTFHETNKIVGNSAGRLNNYMGAVVIANLVIADLLPSSYRKWQLGGVAVFEIRVTYKNYQAGITIPFK